MLNKLTMAALAGLALLLAACAGDAGARQPVLRNSLGVPVDPQTGIPLPGAPGAGGGGY
jgi:hypothetical protein